MPEENDPIQQLLEKHNILIQRQEYLSKEISNLRKEIDLLMTKRAEVATNSTTIAAQKQEVKSPSEGLIVTEEIIIDRPIESFQSVSKKTSPSRSQSDIEKFIGENLISKIGIAITVIGISIGAKYTIEHDLISPLTRIILGYLAGIGLLGIGMKLKKKYNSYSAVLVSGAIAVMYFISYAAYDYYNLIPQVPAFVIMVILTAFAVFAALHYDKQVIALIGLVGAYAIPFLLSDGSGRVAILFSYMAIINIGILAIAIKKYWKTLNHVAFWLTWLIFFVWYLFKYDVLDNFSLAFTFSIIFYLVFYLAFLTYKLLNKKKFDREDVVLILSNSFIFYGIGYALLDNHQLWKASLGLFTLANALLHFIIAAFIYRQKLADKNLFYLVAGLVLVFVTMAVPVQLDGNWVTILWTGEAALLFWIGRSNHVFFYEKLSYILMALATFSIFLDWSVAYNKFYFDVSQKFPSIFNIHFLTSVIFIGAFGFINWIKEKKRNVVLMSQKWSQVPIIKDMIPIVLILVTYLSFRLEIAHYWNQFYAESAFLTIKSDQIIDLEQNGNDFMRFKQIWILNYSLLFLALFSFLNLWKLKSKRIENVSLVLNVIVLIVFLTLGLFTLGELRTSYLNYSSNEVNFGLYNLFIRYITFGFAALNLYACYRIVLQAKDRKFLKRAFDILLHLVILCVASSELINFLELSNSNQSYKLGLSILWGFYSLLLVILGIWKGKKYLRIAAILLFGVTLLKLFFYDIANLGSMAKTIVFISLGILLLIISFLYNKYRNIISNDVES